MPIKVTYSSAAWLHPRGADASDHSKLNQGTQRERARKSGEMHAYISALKILMSLTRRQGQRGSVSGIAWRSSKSKVLAEIERFVGSRHEMIELGFYAKEEEA